MYEIDMLESALRSKDRRIAELERERDQLREAVLALRDDGAWIGGEWVPSEEAQSMADAALKSAEAE